MNGSADIIRGRPVFVLAIILSAWVGGRMVMWEPEQLALPMQLAPLAVSAPETSAPTAPAPERAASLATDVPPSAPTFAPIAAQPAPWMPPLREAPGLLSPTATKPNYGADPGGAGARPSSRVVSHTMLLANTRFDESQLLNGRMRREELPAARPQPAFVPRTAQIAREQGARSERFSADAWGLWRDGMDASVAPGAPSYGRSQMGAVLRYMLSVSSPHVPEAHLRASTALDGGRERDMALGISARPVPDLPVRIAAEGRVTDTQRGTELRAGAYVVSEFAPIDLPAGARGEVYVQGGYVTGEFATAFVDGHARVTRDLAEVNDFRLSAGGGAWGGAQEGTERLDVGPTASVSFPVGEGRARISADYRMRIAGNAEPDSGPALTLATGF